MKEFEQLHSSSQQSLEQTSPLEASPIIDHSNAPLQKPGIVAFFEDAIATGAFGHIHPRKQLLIEAYFTTGASLKKLGQSEGISGGRVRHIKGERIFQVTV